MPPVTTTPVNVVCSGGCTREVPFNDTVEAQNWSGRVCSQCISRNFETCEMCDDYVYDGSLISVDGGNRQVCGRCLNDNYSICHRCDEHYSNEDMCGRYCIGCDQRNENEIRTADFSEDDTYQSKDGAQGSIIKSGRIFGVELETQYGKQEYAAAVSRALPKGVGVTGDGSISGLGLEIQTPPSSGAKGQKLIEDICTTLQKVGRAKTDKSCGLHVHLDAKEIDEMSPNSMFAAVKAIWLFYMAFEDVILSFLPPSRRNGKYCLTLRSDYHFKEIMESKNMEQLEKIWYRVPTRNDLLESKREKKHTSRYRGVNLHTLLADRHIEIRYHSGTVNARKVLEWINLHATIMDTCIHKGVDTEYLKRILGSIDLTEKTTEFFRHLSLNKTSSDYFRSRQALFSTQKIVTIDPENKKAADEILLAEPEA